LRSCESSRTSESGDSGGRIFGISIGRQPGFMAERKGFPAFQGDQFAFQGSGRNSGLTVA
jgi:hypothetical protein